MSKKWNDSVIYDTANDGGGTFIAPDYYHTISKYNKVFNNCLEFILNSRGVLKTNLVFESTKKENSMSNLNGTKTHENLKAAFAGESQANRRY